MPRKSHTQIPLSPTLPSHLLPQTFTDGLPLPKMFVFDLDYTLWPFWVDTHVAPPLKAKDNGTRSVDRCGESFSFYSDVPSLLLALRSLPPLVAAASRTSAPDLATTLLKQLQLPLPASAATTNPSISSLSPFPSSPFLSSSTSSSSSQRAYDVFDHLQIFPGDKKLHFAKLHKATGISYEEMLFFDDEGRNRNVEQLGVCFWLVRDGVTKGEVDKGVREWRRRRGHQAEVKKDGEGGNGVVS